MAQQVEAECEKHLAEARAEADRILSEARERAAASREAALASARSEKERGDALWRQKAEAESIRLELAVRNEAVEAVLDAVQQEIRRLVESPEFDAVLDQLLDELMAAAEDRGDYVVLAPPKRVDRVKQRLADRGKGGVTVEGSEELWDGVAVQDPQKTFRISNTLTGRFHQVEQQVRKHVMTTLFPREGG